MTVEMFRIRFGWKAGNASSWDTRLYESRDALATGLLSLESEIESKPEGSWHMRHRIARMFRAKKGLSDLSYPESHADKIHHVQKLVDGEWVDIEYEFVPAKLMIDGEEYSDERP